MKEKILIFIVSLLLTLSLSGICFAEGGGGGDPAPQDPKCQSIVIER